VWRRADGAAAVMAVLDSDHSYEHVLKELEAYGPLVTPGCYMIVEDTNVNGHPVVPDHGSGPAEAVETFLNESAFFDVDRDRERLLMTFNPGGYLRRRSSTTAA
jgi:cephalosporin hydroxylase